jgi:NAD(P)-dependent dehydrogenase (short-subunit alcohol dehydrogenase family)
MTRQQQFIVGLAAGAAAAFAGGRLQRWRYRIDLAGRRVVITGGSRGLGLVLARQFVEAGAHVALLARDADELQRARQQVDALGARETLTVPCDVRDRVDVERAVDEIRRQWPAIDILVNNAGVIQVGPLEHMTRGDFENAMATHFWGPFHLIQACLPGMRARGFGRIVNISSIGGRVAVPHLAPYSASKFALAGLSDAMRNELAPHGIRVTSVYPGLMRTGSPMNAEMKGRHAAEYTWFALADALPGLSVSAERAAAEIIDACRHGAPELVIGAPARLAIVAQALAPHVVATALATVTRVLPGGGGAAGDAGKAGRETGARWVPSVLTTLSDQAAVANNEL